MPKITIWKPFLIARFAPPAALRPPTNRKIDAQPAIDRRHAAWIGRGAALGSFLLKLSTVRRRRHYSKGGFSVDYTAASQSRLTQLRS